MWRGLWACVFVAKVFGTFGGQEGMQCRLDINDKPPWQCTGNVHTYPAISVRQSEPAKQSRGMVLGTM